MKFTSLKFGVSMAVLTAILLTLSFPFFLAPYANIGKIGLGPLGWVALIPLMFYVLNAKSMRHVIIVAVVCGTLTHFLWLYWLMNTMHKYGGIAWPVAVVMLLAVAVVTSAFWILLLALWRFCAKSVPLAFFGFACCWVLVEYARTWLFTGLPWNLLGYTQHLWLEMIQIADITGVYGLSFSMALLSASIAILLNHHNARINAAKYRRNAVACFVLAGVVMLAIMVYGTARKPAIENMIAQAPTAGKIALVQASIPQDQKWDEAFQNNTLTQYENLSLRAQAEGAELIIWPETAVPFYFPNHRELSQRVFNLMRQTQVPLYIGAPTFRDENQRAMLYNSAVLIEPKGYIVAVYDKYHLVPFGEYVPLQDLFFFISKLTSEAGSFNRGEAGRIVNSGNLRIGTQICYEGIFPMLNRQAVLNGANLFINLTNDGWYDYSAGPYQHFVNTKFRAVETRRTLLRCANTGITAHVLATGAVQDATHLFDETVLIANPALLKTKTFYVKHGDVFAQIISVLGVLLAIMGFYTGRRQLMGN